MSFEIPNLDKKTYQEMLELLINSIPIYSQQWTNFNPSDPGITLLEMLCWIGKTQLYRLNKIPNLTYINFLRLIAGATGNEIDKLLIQLEAEKLDQDYIDLLSYLKSLENSYHADINELRVNTLRFFNAPFTAVTEQDFEILALQTNRIIPADKPKISRAIVQTDLDLVTIVVIPEITLNYTPLIDKKKSLTQTSIAQSSLILGSSSNKPDVYKTLIKQVQNYLAPRTLIGCIVDVVKPIFTPVNISLQIMVQADILLPPILTSINQCIIRFLDPITGGKNKNGWPYNHAPTSEEISKLIIDIPGIKAIQLVNINFIPTIELNHWATLGVNTMLANVPSGFSQPEFMGLAQLRFLSIKVIKNVNS